MSSSAFSSFGFDSGCLWKDQMKYGKSKRRSAGKVFVKCSVNAKAQNTEKSVRIGVLGASGYTGSESRQFGPLPAVHENKLHQLAPFGCICVAIALLQQRVHSCLHFLYRAFLSNCFYQHCPVAFLH
ncbi:hypothetical protein L484_026900 [Morus notabilis]|uniref:Semialdehyde dehydrogenase NAD-binding domain-containing protein n=1 Tax=Morus notabilis TaxID=981085 RepID=W9RPC7_9ROSA|nr:hypothetical protein L484_026900 [Morus notabilis]